MGPRSNSGLPGQGGVVGGRASWKEAPLTNVPDVRSAKDPLKKILTAFKIKQNSKLKIDASIATSILRRN